MLAQESDPAWVAQLKEWHLWPAFRIGVVLVVAVVLTLVARWLIHRIVNAVASLTERTSLVDDPARIEARSRTISTALRSAALGLIWTCAVLVVLDLLGINLTAFVVTASVIGGAIGFGAQQLVRDLLAGLFIVSEDQYGVGDSVAITITGGTEVSGTVEAVSLRVTRVRDLDGTVWWVPNGQILRSGNRSLEWSEALVEVSVAPDSDPPAVLSTLDEAARQAVSPEDVASVVTGEPRVQGPEHLAHDRMLFRVLVRTLPGKQFDVNRRLRAGVQAALNDGRLVPVPGDRVSLVTSDVRPPRGQDDG